MRNNCDFFSFKDSSFAIQKDKESTARVYIQEFPPFPKEIGAIMERIFIDKLLYS